MKTLKYILPFCCVALASCSDLNVETPTVEETRAVKTVLTAVIGSETKTVLGDKHESDEYPVSWSALDRINVNGCESVGIVLNSGSATANFSFTDEMTAPYRAIYPASAYGSETVVSIPGNQTYKAGTFDEGSAVLYAYSTAGSRLVFHQLMSYLKLSFNTEADPDNIKTIVVKSKGVEPMSGDFSFDFTALSPALSPMPEAPVGSVTVDCGEDGVALGTDVIVAIPAQKYASGIEITTTDVNGDKTVHVLILPLRLILEQSILCRLPSNSILALVKSRLRSEICFGLRSIADIAKNILTVCFINGEDLPVSHISRQARTIMILSRPLRLLSLKRNCFMLLLMVRKTMIGMTEQRSVLGQCPKVMRDIWKQ